VEEDKKISGELVKAVGLWKKPSQTLKVKLKTSSCVLLRRWGERDQEGKEGGISCAYESNLMKGRAASFLGDSGARRSRKKALGQEHPREDHSQA